VSARQAALEAAAQHIHRIASEDPAEPPPGGALQLALNIYGGDTLEGRSDIVGFRVSVVAGKTQIHLRMADTPRVRHLHIARALAALHFPSLPGRELAMCIMAPAPAVLPLLDRSDQELAGHFVMPLECARWRRQSLRLKLVAARNSRRAGG
jgi:hypothetical protein